MSPGAPPAIQVRDLRKSYQVPEREGGLRAAAGSLFRRRTREVLAVDGISFDVAPGEIVGFLGPNGAGKTTTLKVLSGLLHPTAGEVRSLGHVPWERETEFLRRMTLIMGQRNQLSWDIPVIDSFELNRAIFQVPRDEYRQRLAELSDLLELGDLVRKPVRNLSLGERMKCEFAGSLLHRPEVLFLDEPTIGLDVTMQRRIRGFIQQYNGKTGATTLLTSHYMADVEALCRRVIVIHHGRLLYDGDLSGLVTRFSPYKTITLDLQPSDSDVDPLVHELVEDGAWIVSVSQERITLRVPRSETARVTTRFLTQLEVIDVMVEEPAIDEVIDLVFAASPDAATAERAQAGQRSDA